jgi:phosphopantothenoylcysteine decarboxylase/phosphopantothenate--cysteine ligase
VVCARGRRFLQESVNIHDLKNSTGEWQMKTVSLLQEKQILLGVTGGIAAYKVCMLASRLTQAGARVDVVMTEAATHFVAPLTFQALSGRPVYADLWGGSTEGLPTHIAHVGLAHAADLLLVAPATANTMAKLARGLADNMLSTLALAARCPTLIAPAMDVGMWAHPATQANVAILGDRGVHFAGPARGRMASGLEGEGRLLEPEELFGHVRRVLGLDGALAGRKVVVTAGPTWEPIDPVRFITNPSSGRQGFALAQAAVDQGAAVTLICGPTSLSTPVGAHRVDVKRVEEMRNETALACQEADVLIMAAAVSDFRPRKVASQKIKKAEQELTLQLTGTTDILSQVAVQRQETGFPRIVVGFAAESSDLIANARSKLAQKRLDLIVANDITADDAGFGVETNRVVLIGRDQEAEELPVMSKTAVAETVLKRTVELYRDAR